MQRRPSKESGSPCALYRPFGRARRCVRPVDTVLKRPRWLLSRAEADHSYTFTKSLFLLAHSIHSQIVQVGQVHWQKMLFLSFIYRLVHFFLDYDEMCNGTSFFSSTAALNNFQGWVSYNLLFLHNYFPMIYSRDRSQFPTSSWPPRGRSGARLSWRSISSTLTAKRQRQGRERWRARSCVRGFVWPLSRVPR
jgi:hypothetical protein